MRAVCIYCGSNPGNNGEYARAARAAGEALVRRGLALVYGGGRTGMMGVVVNTVLSGGGRAVGVIPNGLFRPDSIHRGLTELHVVGSMHERKALMIRLADAFVGLPGGLGTLEEICEVLAWSQLGLHAKPCGVLNVAGYFDALRAFLDGAVRSGFVQPRHRELLAVEDDIERLLQRFEDFLPPAVADQVHTEKI